MNQTKSGAFIAEMRKKAGLTQRELANQIGISDKTISKWETGKSMPDLSYIDSLCNILGISMNELLSGEKIEEAAYSEKAEETIMELMKENERNKKAGKFSTIIGLLMTIVGLFLTLAITETGAYSVLVYFIDVPSIIIVAIIAVGCVLVSGQVNYRDVLYTLKKVLLPIGGLVTLMSLVIVLATLRDNMKLTANIAVAILPMVYSFIAYIIVIVMHSRAGE